MNQTYPIATVAELLSDRARACMLLALLEGQALPAGELARIARASPQSASGHLSKLVDGGLLKVQSQGRHRYYRMAGPDVAHALEALSAIATTPRQRGPLVTSEEAAIYTVRSCYDHLAGRVAVEMAHALEADKVIRRIGEREYAVGPRGARWFVRFGVDVEGVARSRRAFALQCLDWTERKSHIAGALGAALLSRMLELGWFARRKQTRALRITHRGAIELRKQFGVAS